MEWNFASDRPIYSQLMEQFIMAIVTGEYSPGEKMASVRDLASEAGVNPNTMQKALSELERDGLVYTMRTAGRYITEDGNMIKEKKEEIAKNEIQKFLVQMNRLGLTAEETINIIKGEINK